MSALSAWLMPDVGSDRELPESEHEEAAATSAAAASRPRAQRPATCHQAGQRRSDFAHCPRSLATDAQAPPTFYATASSTGFQWQRAFQRLIWRTFTERRSVCVHRLTCRGERASFWRSGSLRSGHPQRRDLGQLVDVLFPTEGPGPPCRRKLNHCWMFYSDQVKRLPEGDKRRQVAEKNLEVLDQRKNRMEARQKTPAGRLRRDGGGGARASDARVTAQRGLPKQPDMFGLGIVLHRPPPRHRTPLRTWDNRPSGRLPRGLLMHPGGAGQREERAGIAARGTHEAEESRHHASPRALPP